jgi:hypothetical protein
VGIVVVGGMVVVHTIGTPVSTIGEIVSVLGGGVGIVIVSGVVGGGGRLSIFSGRGSFGSTAHIEIKVYQWCRENLG